MISVGFVFTRFNVNTDDYFRNGCKGTHWLVGMSTFMISFTAWTFTGAPGAAFQAGWTVFFIYMAGPRWRCLKTGDMANLEKHYHELLGLTDGWKVTKVELELAKLRVEIEVEWTGPRVVSCPDCGEAVSLYDLCEERTWRHLDMMQFETV